MEALNAHLLRIFDWLLWTTIQGSMLIVLIVLIQKILRRRLPIRWHYFVWTLLLIRLAVPWLPESKISIFNLVPRSVQQGRIIESYSQSHSPDEMGFYMQAGSEETEQAETATVKFVRTLPTLWLFGTILIAAFVCVRSIRLWRTVKRERPITDQKILDMLEDCKMQMQVETIVAVVVSDRIKSPALFGFVRPRLLLPQGMLETYGLEELRYVFIHELAHLKQRDIYLGWLMALLHVAHWFNPLMWFAFSRIRADREIACDRLAISTMEPDEPPQYGRTIVSLLERFSQTRYLPSVAGILEDTCQMERRIKMIADYKKTPRPRWAGAMLLLAVLACLVLTNAYVAKADFIFGEPVNLGSTVNTLYSEACQSISADGLTLYFGEIPPDHDPSGYGGGDIWVTMRNTISDAWGPRTNLGPPVNTSSGEATPCMSADGLSLYFASNRVGGHGNWDLWVATRATTEDDWGSPENLGPTVNSSADEGFPSISADGLELYFSDYQVTRPGGYYDLWVTKRPTKDDPWGTPVNLGDTVNSSTLDIQPFISADRLTLFFASWRPGGISTDDIWMTKRLTDSDPWCTPVNLGPPINSPFKDGCPSFSPNGSTLYFCSDRSGDFDLWQASVIPIVDFNGDGNIDTDDLLIMIGNWSTDESLCDIGPMPWGDGVVDIEDLIVFIKYWEQENMPQEPDEGE